MGWLLRLGMRRIIGGLLRKGRRVDALVETEQYGGLDGYVAIREQYEMLGSRYGYTTSCHF